MCHQNHSTLAKVDLSVQEHKTFEELAEKICIVFKLEEPTAEQQLQSAGVKDAANANHNHKWPEETAHPSPRPRSGAGG